MIKQRTTIFNPNESNDDVVSSIERNQVVFKTGSADNSTTPFIVENKITVPLDQTLISQYNLIKQVRIQTSDESVTDDVVFTYKFNHGTNIYILPKNVHNQEQQAQFYEQVNDLLQHLLNIDVKSENWIRITNSLYYHDESPRTLSLDWFSQVDDLVDSHTYDIFFNNDDSEGNASIVLKQLAHLPYSTDYTIKLKDNIRKEIGLFIIDKVISSPDDIVLSGIRAILNKEEAESDEEYIFKTLFHIKPRHRIVDGLSDSRIVENGLHPIIKSTFNSFEEKQDSDVIECKLYYYINLNKSLIFDKYQSIPVGANLIVNNGVSNLELPEYKISEWGNEILFEFDNITTNNIEFTVHSRYQLPSNITNSTVIHNSLPQLFYACNVRDDYLLDKSPFDTKLSIGGNYETYFTGDTVFYHIDHTSNSSIVVNIPNANDSIDRISTISILTVLFGVGIILFQLFRVIFRAPKVTATRKNE
ncbi:PIG-X [Scheffersomyces amazonensis]|uniref:PIG-X n=1 Tax=Scheffersomyces amazonensis TaxID=1078765 RepID=UPI00315CBB1F